MEKGSITMTKLSLCLPVTLIIAGYLCVGASVQAMPVLPATNLLSTADTGILHVRAKTTTKKSKKIAAMFTEALTPYM
jgi:hypothetical protein